MSYKRFIKKFSTNVSFRKKVISIGMISIIGIFAFVCIAKDVDISASVLNLNNIIQNKNSKTIKLVQDSCIDTDGGIAYDVKGTITTIINGYTRVEEDSCNSNGTLRERFCGNSGDIAGLLRSENYVTCPNGCNNGICTPQSTGMQIGDAIIEDMYMLPNNTPLIGTDNATNKINFVIKNIGSGTLHLPLLNGANRISFFCSYNLGGGGFITIPLSGSTLAPNTSLTTQLQIQDDDVYGRFSTNGPRYITCTIVSQQQQNRQNPDPNNTDILYEANGTNNSFTLNYTVTGTVEPLPLSGDAIIEDMYIVPSNTPIVGSNNATNKIKLVIKNIGVGTLTIPQNNFNIICMYNQGQGGFDTEQVSINTLAPNESVTTQLDMGNYPENDYRHRYDTLGPKYIACTIVSQQQQNRQTPDPNSTDLLYEADGTNNSFTLNYTVTGTVEPLPLSGDIIIEDMYIVPNPAILELTNVINKVNLKVKNIGVGDIIIPYANGAQRLSLGCYGGGYGGGTLTIPIGQTILGPNESITTQLYNTSDYRFNSIGQKSLTCTIDSQQEGSWSTPNPYNTGTIYESNGENNSFTLNYTVSGTLELPQGDLIIENMYMTPDNTPTVGTDALTNIFNLVIKNIGIGNVTIPANTYTKIWLICYYNVGHGGFYTLPLNINTISPNQSITTQIEILNPAVDPGWFDTLGSKYMQCTIVSQQQQNRQTPDPNNGNMIYETDGTNNSFTLNYEVISNK